MKKVALFVLFLGMVVAQAQSFKLYEVVGESEGDEIPNGTTLKDTCEAFELDGEWQVVGELSVVVENASSEAKIVVCVREIIQPVEGATIDVCWGNCGDNDTSVTTMEANMKTGVGEFITHYSAPCVAGSCIARFVFYDENDRSDSVSVVFEYVTLEGTKVPVHIADNSLSVYPNPVNEQLTINSEQLTIEKIEVYNVVGQCVYTTSLRGTQCRSNPENNNENSGLLRYARNDEVVIDVSHLENGIYFLHIISNGGRVYTQKILKQ